jgi:hypothetical protein
MSAISAAPLVGIVILATIGQPHSTKLATFTEPAMSGLGSFASIFETSSCDKQTCASGGFLREPAQIKRPAHLRSPSAPPCNLKRHFGFWVQQLFSLGPTLEKVELSCVGVWLVFGNYGCTEHVRVEVLKGCRVNSASLPFLTQSGLW